MTRPQLTPPAGVLVAIDFAKARNEVLIEVPGSGRRRRLSALNTRAEHDRLIALLSDLGQPVTCGFEATGNYHRPIAWRLLQAGFAVHMISSVGLARTREALHNGWDKNDPKDAQVMLHMIRIGASQLYHDPLAAGINDVQELSKTHDAVSRAKTEVLHRILTHYLPLYFPEVDRFRHNSRSDWFFAFLDRFPTPACITALSKEAFIAAAWDVVGRKVAKAQLLGDIYETARSSIGLPVPPDAPAVSMFRLVIGEARGLIQQRDAIEADAASSPSPRWPSSRLFSVRRASEVFSQRLTQRRHVEHRLGQELLELPVLLVERLQAMSVRDLHAAEARAPRVERRVADAVAAADLSHRQPGLLLLQDTDDLLFAEPALLHRPSPHRRTLASERGQARGQGKLHASRMPPLSRRRRLRRI